MLAGIGSGHAKDGAGGNVDHLADFGGEGGLQKIFRAMYIYRMEQLFVLGQGHLGHAMINRGSYALPHIA